MGLINEYDQIRHSLNRIRVLMEDENINLKGDSAYSDETNKSGEEIQFDGINTVGFLNSDIQLDGDVKSNLISSIGEFIMSTGLIINTISISIENGKMLLVTETLKNPNTDVIKSVIFNTDEDSPKIEFISGTMSLNDDINGLFGNIYRTYNDPQIGKNKLLSMIV